MNIAQVLVQGKYNGSVESGRLKGSRDYMRNYEMTVEYVKMPCCRW